MQLFLKTTVFTVRAYYTAVRLQLNLDEVKRRGQALRFSICHYEIHHCRYEIHQL